MASNIFGTGQEDGLFCEFAAEMSAESNFVCTLDFDSDICSVIGVTESPTLSPSIAPSEFPTDVPTKAPFATPAVPETTTTVPVSESSAYAYGRGMTLLLASVVSIGILVV